MWRLALTLILTLSASFALALAGAIEIVPILDDPAVSARAEWLIRHPYRVTYKGRHPDVDRGPDFDRAVAKRLGHIIDETDSDRRRGALAALSRLPRARDEIEVISTRQLRENNPALVAEVFSLLTQLGISSPQLLDRARQLSRINKASGINAAHYYIASIRHLHFSLFELDHALRSNDLEARGIADAVLFGSDTTRSLAQIDDLSRHSDFSKRRLAVSAMMWCDVGDLQIIDRLSNLLRDEEWSVRMVCCEALAGLTSHQAQLRALLERAKHDADRFVQRAAERALQLLR